MGELATIEHEGNALAVAGPVDWKAQADQAIAQAHAFERIKAESLNASDYDVIEGKKVPNAIGIAKLGVPCGHSCEIISRNEHGDTGVRRTIQADLVWPTKTVKKKGRDGWYDKVVPDLEGDPREIKAIIYTVTVKVTDRWGRSKEQDASMYDPTRDDNANRAMVVKRAAKKAAEWLVGGVNSEAGAYQAQRQQVVRNAGPNLRAMQAECESRGWIPEDDEAFLDFMREKVPGCSDMEKPLLKHATALAKFLEATQ